MKTGIPFVVALCSVLIVAALRADLPATNQVVRYERCDAEGKWREVTKSDGEIVLACLRDIDSFKTWGSTVPPGIIADPIPPVIGFRIVSSSGKTNVVHFSWNAELVDCPQGLLVVPEKEEKLLAELLAKWGEADSARIASQPLPCNYSFGTANDGGTLSGVARLFYGDSTQWRRIYEANKTIIKNPNIIHLGTRITIPRLEEASNNKRSAANDNQPFGSGTNTTSAAAGSGCPLLAIWREYDGNELCFRLRILIWNDGRVVFSKDAPEWGTNLYQGNLTALEISELKQRIRATGVFRLSQINLEPGEAICNLMMDFESEKQFLTWDERNLRFYWNDDPRYSSGATHGGFRHTWVSVNRIALDFTPQQVTKCTNSFEGPPLSWYKK